MTFIGETEDVDEVLYILFVSTDDIRGLILFQEHYICTKSKIVSRGVQ